MIKDRWYAVSSSESVRTRPLSLRRLGHDLVLWRDGSGAVCAAAARCPHKGAKLSTGTVCQGELVCPYHGFSFGSDGACTAMPVHPGQSPPPAMRLRRGQTAEAHGLIWLWHGDRAATRPVPVLSTLEPRASTPGGCVWVGADAGAARYVQWRARQLRCAHDREDRLAPPAL
jgi:phenylpropionate dioxygenase-like ring-hydroxylating dioxygenase large terminal subunit